MKSSDSAFFRTFSGRVAGPAAKLKTRSWDWVGEIVADRSWVWVAHVIERGLKERFCGVEVLGK